MNQKMLRILAVAAAGTLVLILLQQIKINQLEEELALYSKPAAASVASGRGEVRMEARSIENLKSRATKSIDVL